MKRLKLYVETSVWSFLFAADAPEKKAATERFFREVEAGKHEIFISEAVQEEISFAPVEKRKMLYRLIEDTTPLSLRKTRKPGSLRRGTSRTACFQGIISTTCCIWPTLP